MESAATVSTLPWLATPSRPLPGALPGARLRRDHDYGYDHDDNDKDALSLSHDTIPCSPYVTQPTLLTSTRPTASSQYVTQPTQALPAKLSRAAVGSSSPLSTKISTSSLVEVPASSPFRPPWTLGARLTPAGTSFCPPASRPEARSGSGPGSRPASGIKRPAPEPISISSDEEADKGGDSPRRRGDIRPTVFATNISDFRYGGPLGKKAGSGFAPTRANAFDALMGQAAGPKSATLDLTDYPESGRVANERKKSSFRSPADISRSESQTSSTTSSGPRQRRRLVRGLPPRSSPVSSQVRDLGSGAALPARQTEAPRSPDPPTVRQVNSIDSDEDPESYQDEDSMEFEQHSDDRLIRCLNTGTLDDLTAMTKTDKEHLDLFILRRPFSSLAAAKAVVLNRKTASRKVQRVPVGESIVEAVDQFMQSTAAIDEIVAECEAKAGTISEQINGWNLDMFGLSRRASATPFSPPPPPGGVPLGVQPLSPLNNSSSGHDKEGGSGGARQAGLVAPAIARQPQLMDGHCEMKAFQLFGLNWLNVLYENGFGCILADEMGLGKTCQIISLMCHLAASESRGRNGDRSENRQWPNLIVVPPTTYANWLAEFARFAPGLSVIGYQGSQASRAAIAEAVLESPQSYHVVLSTYTQITTEADVETMRELRPNVAVFDEGHRMKNPKTNAYRDLVKIPANWRVLLTGTPIQNNLLELVSLLNFINPRLFRRHGDHIQALFSQRVSIRDLGHSAFLYSERVRRARVILEPFILQRRKDQVTEMPRKTRTITRCALTEFQRPLYDRYENLFRTERSRRVVGNSGGMGARQNDQNNAWMQLRKAALHPQLFRLWFTDEKVEEMGRILMRSVPQSELQQPELKHLTAELKGCSDFELHLWCRDYSCLRGFDVPAGSWLDSGKVKKLLELIRGWMRTGERVLVFSKFSKMVDILHEALFVEGIEHRVLTGATSVGERQAIIDDFSADPSIPAFLLTTAAGGTGINLTAANKVVIFDQSDNPQDDVQAENRAHRLGQCRDVEVVRLVAQDTIEELILGACEKKLELANRVTGAGPGLDADANTDAKSETVEEEVRKMLCKQLTPP